MTTPSLFQVNTRVWLNKLAEPFSHPATLDDVPDAELDNWARLGFNWIYLLSVWQTGEAGREISRSRPEWRKEFEEILPDLRDEDIPGSGFAIYKYRVSKDIGGEESLIRFRERLTRRGISLMLDFVPNHMAPDHPWTLSHPGFFIQVSEDEFRRNPQNYMRLRINNEERILACGKDPWFPGWPDTLQLNYGNPELHQAMTGELLNIAGLCDGLRCDMAMLLLPEVFERTWGIRMDPFWSPAIRLIKRQHPGFTFMGEVYWDMEWEMQRQGFDYTYDKRLYDRLRSLEAKPVREHLMADTGYQQKLARFLENHDEKRAATVFPAEIHQAAAIITYLVPGLRFFHQGQLQGFKKKISPHLGRGPDEAGDPLIAGFYARLLDIIRRPPIKAGSWELLECTPAWEGNPTVDNFIAFLWSNEAEERLLFIINYASYQGQSFVRLPFRNLSGNAWRFNDLMSNIEFEREGDDLFRRGLYLDLRAWDYHVFEVKK
jgi:glycosidase